MSECPACDSASLAIQQETGNPNATTKCVLHGAENLILAQAEVEVAEADYARVAGMFKAKLTQRGDMLEAFHDAGGDVDGLDTSKGTRESWKRVLQGRLAVRRHHD